jgi:hypothetical protein
MRGRLASAAGGCVLTVLASGAAGAQSAGDPFQLAVCLSLSPKVSISARGAAVAMAESNAIWIQHGVGIRWMAQSGGRCDRLIAVKGDQEALAEDATSESALGWVPFVEGRARHVVFLRVDRARLMVNALSPGTRPDGLTELLVAKLLGRSLAHELGHVLLNIRSHEKSGLMRARYHASEVLSIPTPAYTLNAVERARLFARRAGAPPLATR